MTTEIKVARDLRTLLANEAVEGTGIATCTKGKHKRLFCVKDGYLIYALSNIVEEQFDRTIIDEHVLDEATVGSIFQQAKETDTKFGTFLMQQGFPAEDVLRAIMEKHVLRLVDDTNGWKGAHFRFDHGIPDLDGEPLANLSVVTWLVDSSRSFLSKRPEDIRARIGPPSIRLKLKENTEALQQRLPDDKLLKFLLTGCDGRVPLRQLETEAPGTETEVLQRLHTLLILGILAPVTESVEGMAGMKPVTREECESRLKQAESATHYLVLGLANEVTTDEIREAYYYLARRFHPDRFRSGVLQDLLPKVESYFAKVTEAYNTLSNELLRRDYDEVLAGDRASDVEETKDSAYLARENFARAKIMISRNQYQDAVQFLENALGLDVKPLYLIELGRLLIRNPRQRSQAQEYLVHATTLDPTNAEGWAALGQLHIKAGRPDSAREAFGQAVHWDPFHEAANAGLAQLGAAPKKKADDGDDDDKQKKKGLFKGLFRS